MPAFPKLRPDPLNQHAGYCETHAFIPAGLSQYERVQPDDLACGVYKWSAAVAWIDRSISLDKQEGAVRIRLARNGTDHAHTHRVLQSRRTSEREYNLPLPQFVIIRERQRRQLATRDLDQSQVTFLEYADQRRFARLQVALRDHVCYRLLTGGLKTDTDLLRRLNHVCIGNDIAFRIDDHPRSDGLLFTGYQGRIAVLFARAIPRHLDFYDAPRYTRRQVLDRGTEFFELRHDRTEGTARSDKEGQKGGANRNTVEWLASGYSHVFSILSNFTGQFGGAYLAPTLQVGRSSPRLRGLKILKAIRVVNAGVVRN